MISVNIDRLRRRVERARNQLLAKEGSRPSWKWRTALPDGTYKEIHYLDVKTDAEWEDQLQNLIHWVATIKDYARNAEKAATGNDNRIIQLINTSQALLLCLDLDNREKHEEVTKVHKGKLGWSGLAPRIKGVTITFPMIGGPENGLLIVPKRSGNQTNEDPRNLKVDFQNMEFKHRKPHLVEVRAPLLDDKGNNIGDAFDILEQAILAWESILK